MRLIKLGSTLFIAALAVGCGAPRSEDGKKHEAAAVKHEDAAAVEHAKAGQADAKAGAEAKVKAQAELAAKEKAEATKDYAFAQRAELVEKLNKDLEAIQLELDQLAAKNETSRAEAKLKAASKAELDAVRAHLTAARAHVEGSRKATESNWEQMKTEIRTSVGELEQSWAKARQQVSDKIAP